MGSQYVEGRTGWAFAGVMTGWGRSDRLAGVFDELRAGWAACLPVERLAYRVGLLLMASGVGHVGVFLVDGGPWDGPVSWRKAVTFGLSFGLTLITITWVAGYVRLRRRTRTVLLGLFSAACVLETALVTMQAWRRVPSHFDLQTTVDGVIARTLAVGGAVLIFVIAYLTVAALRTGREITDGPDQDAEASGSDRARPAEGDSARLKAASGDRARRVEVGSMRVEAFGGDRADSVRVKAAGGSGRVGRPSGLGGYGGAVGAGPDGGMRFAVAAGLLLLDVALLIGAVMIARGMLEVFSGHQQRAYEVGGFLKAAHGAAMHAILVLPAQAWLLTHTRLPERQRLDLIRLTCVAFVLLTIAGGLTTLPPAALTLTTLAALAFLASGVRTLTTLTKEQPANRP